MSRLIVTVDGFSFEVEVELLPNGDQQVTVLAENEPLKVITPDFNVRAGQMEWFMINDRSYEVMIDPDLEWVRSAWGIHSLEIEDLETRVPRPVTGDGRIKAPIPGNISQVLVAPGDLVEAGQPLMVLEAMKMENEIRAPRTGVVKVIHVTAGARVVLEDILIEME